MADEPLRFEVELDTAKAQAELAALARSASGQDGVIPIRVELVGTEKALAEAEAAGKAIDEALNARSTSSATPLGAAASIGLSDQASLAPIIAQVTELVSALDIATASAAALRAELAAIGDTKLDIDLSGVAARREAERAAQAETLAGIAAERSAIAEGARAQQHLSTAAGESRVAIAGVANEANSLGAGREATLATQLFGQNFNTAVGDAMLSLIEIDNLLSSVGADFEKVVIKGGEVASATSKMDFTGGLRRQVTVGPDPGGGDVGVMSVVFTDATKEIERAEAAAAKAARTVDGLGNISLNALRGNLSGVVRDAVRLGEGVDLATVKLGKLNAAGQAVGTARSGSQIEAFTLGTNAEGDIVKTVKGLTDIEAASRAARGTMVQLGTAAAEVKLKNLSNKDFETLDLGGLVSELKRQGLQVREITGSVGSDVDKLTATVVRSFQDAKGKVSSSKPFTLDVGTSETGLKDITGGIEETGRAADAASPKIVKLITSFAQTPAGLAAIAAGAIVMATELGVATAAVGGLLSATGRLRDVQVQLGDFSAGTQAAFADLVGSSDASGKSLSTSFVAVQRVFKTTGAESVALADQLGTLTDRFKVSDPVGVANAAKTLTATGITGKQAFDLLAQGAQRSGVSVDDLSKKVIQLGGGLDAAGFGAGQIAQIGELATAAQLPFEAFARGIRDVGINAGLSGQTASDAFTLLTDSIRNAATASEGSALAIAAGFDPAVAERFSEAVRAQNFVLGDNNKLLADAAVAAEEVRTKGGTLSQVWHRLKSNFSEPFLRISADEATALFATFEELVPAVHELGLQFAESAPAIVKSLGDILPVVADLVKGIAAVTPVVLFLIDTLDKQFVQPLGTSVQILTGFVNGVGEAFSNVANTFVEDGRTILNVLGAVGRFVGVVPEKAGASAPDPTFTAEQVKASDLARDTALANRDVADTLFARARAEVALAEAMRARGVDEFSVAKAANEAEAAQRGVIAAFADGNFSDAEFVALIASAGGAAIGVDTISKAAENLRGQLASVGGASSAAGQAVVGLAQVLISSGVPAISATSQALATYNRIAASVAGTTPTLGQAIATLSEVSTGSSKALKSAADDSVKALEAQKRSLDGQSRTLDDQLRSVKDAADARKALIDEESRSIKDLAQDRKDALDKELRGIDDRVSALRGETDGLSKLSDVERRRVQQQRDALLLNVQGIDMAIRSTEASKEARRQVLLGEQARLQKQDLSGGVDLAGVTQQIAELDASTAAGVAALLEVQVGVKKDLAEAQAQLDGDTTKRNAETLIKSLEVQKKGITDQKAEITDAAAAATKALDIQKRQLDADTKSITDGIGTQKRALDDQKQAISDQIAQVRDNLADATDALGSGVSGAAKKATVAIGDAFNLLQKTFTGRAAATQKAIDLIKRGFGNSVLLIFDSGASAEEQALLLDQITSSTDAQVKALNDQATTILTEKGILGGKQLELDALLAKQAGKALTAEQDQRLRDITAFYSGIDEFVTGQGLTTGANYVAGLTSADNFDPAVFDAATQSLTANAPDDLATAGTTAGANYVAGLTSADNFDPAALDAAAKVLTSGGSAVARTAGTVAGGQYVAGLTSADNFDPAALAGAAQALMGGTGVTDALRLGGKASGQEFNAGLADGLKVQWLVDGVTNTARDVASQLIQAVRDKLRTGSPSKEAYDIGVHWNQGLRDGIIGSAGLVADAGSMATNPLLAAVAGKASVDFSAQMNAQLLAPSTVNIAPGDIAALLQALAALQPDRGPNIPRRPVPAGR